MNTETKQGNKLISDEIGMMPIVFNMGGSKFRWDVFKMAYEMSHPKSLDKIISTANENN